MAARKLEQDFLLGNSTHTTDGLEQKMSLSKQAQVTGRSIRIISHSAPVSVLLTPTLDGWNYTNGKILKNKEEEVNISVQKHNNLG